MALENKLGINDSAELAREEEKISKIKAIKLYESQIIEEVEAGKFSGLAKNRVCQVKCVSFFDFFGGRVNRPPFCICN